MEKHVLTGEKITNIQIASDKKAIKFFVESDLIEIIAKADGDCCSDTWIENVELPDNKYPFFVINVEDININNDDEYIDGDLIQFYGCKIKTDKGDIIIDYRNLSNGYYGGNLCWADDNFYGGVYGQNESNMDFKELKEVLI